MPRSVLAAIATMVLLGCGPASRGGASVAPDSSVAGPVHVPASLAGACALKPPESFAFDSTQAGSPVRGARCFDAPDAGLDPAALPRHDASSEQARTDAVAKFLLAAEPSHARR